jgi:ribonuclease Z
MIHSTICNSYFIKEKDKFKINKSKIKKLPFDHKLLKNFKEGKDIKFQNKIYSFKDYTEFEKGKKISFVLDTSFNKKIIPFVKDSDVLICESTFDSSLNEKAKEYFHLTIEDALKIAKKSNSKKLYLTHLSQRYEKDFKNLENYAKKTFKETFLVKDFDEILI